MGEAATTTGHGLEERIARLERVLGPELVADPLPTARLSTRTTVFAYALGAGGAYLGYLGLGLPNHPYQVVLAVLAVALGYHRRWFLVPEKAVGLALPLLNATCLAMLMKIFIGSGIRRPLEWLKYPSLTFTKPEGMLNIVPETRVVWENTPLAMWELDLTILQTFLLVVTLVGSLFRFQPFASLTAFLLILVSLPAFASFDWRWVFPAILSAAVVFYAQSSLSRSR